VAVPGTGFRMFLCREETLTGWNLAGLSWGIRRHFLRVCCRPGHDQICVGVNGWTGFEGARGSGSNGCLGSSVAYTSQMYKEGGPYIRR